jgi:membrane protease YdiL (CAAX protease family)
MQSRIAGLFGAPPSNKPAPPFFTIGPPGHTTQLHVSGLSGLAVAVGFPLFEELVFRLFLFTFLAWVTAKLLRTSSCVPSSALWVVNFIQAYCFGLFHVPNGSLIWWEPWYLQALAAPQCWLGLLTGYLYWRHGLESAVLAHLSADLMLVVAITLL